jgi:hypothetical protein
MDPYYISPAEEARQEALRSDAIDEFREAVSVADDDFSAALSPADRARVLREEADQLDPPAPPADSREDILAALKTAEAQLDAMDRNGMSCGSELRQVRDAIAKAEGKHA